MRDGSKLAAYRTNIEMSRASSAKLFLRHNEIDRFSESFTVKYFTTITNQMTHTTLFSAVA